MVLYALFLLPTLVDGQEDKGTGQQERHDDRTIHTLGTGQHNVTQCRPKQHNADQLGLGEFSFHKSQYGFVKVSFCWLSAD